jgi:hypothetical protein
VFRDVAVFARDLLVWIEREGFVELSHGVGRLVHLQQQLVVGGAELGVVRFGGDQRKSKMLCWTVMSMPGKPVPGSDSRRRAERARSTSRFA